MRGRRYEVRGPLDSALFFRLKKAQQQFLGRMTSASSVPTEFRFRGRPAYDLIDRKTRETLEQWP